MRYALVPVEFVMHSSRTLSGWIAKILLLMISRSLKQVHGLSILNLLVPGWIELNFQGISGTVYQTSVVFNMLSSIYFGTFVDAFSSLFVTKLMYYN